MSSGFVYTNPSSHVLGSRGKSLFSSVSVKRWCYIVQLISLPRKDPPRPETTAEGDAAGTLDGSAVDPVLPPVEPVSGGSQQLRMNH
ncbi:hypothetical protein Bca52824_033256 [Brassica carinata]|uniref:Uncharacterized protein n=1 Tax=Brassica carinata TaxID=52824 RepID=A0A8X7V5W7_BRACI|nr:hypothetical protein Bca52824_033256 [Brassica carinata]